MRQFLQYFSNAKGGGIECLWSDVINHRLYACLKNECSYFLISPASWYQAFPAECWKFVKCSPFTAEHKNLVL